MNGDFPEPSSSSAAPPIFDISGPEYRKITQITGAKPKSAILAEVEAGKQVNVCRAPPKSVPNQLRKDFITGRRNAAACLNEVCQLQRWTCKFVETTPSRHFDAYGRSLFAITAIVGGYEYDPGEARNKKEAKVEAAKNALNEILCVNTDSKHASGGAEKKCRDLYGREVAVERKTLSTAPPLGTDYCRPLPRPVVPQKTNFLPAPSAEQEMKLKRKQSLPYESIGCLAEQKFYQLLSGFASLNKSIHRHTFAAFIVKRTSMPGEVVAVGSGDMCYHGQNLCTDGTLLFDCHAETVARRAFRRYLIKQVALWYQGDDRAKNQCIFEKTQDTDMLCLKDSVTIHLYLSEPPKGLARSLKAPLAAQELVSSDSYNLTYLTKSGSFDVQTDCDNPFMVTAKQLLAIGNDDVSMVCMSGSDKILKWNVCGMQGSLLSLFVEPVCLNSITLGCESSANLTAGKCESTIVAVNKRVKADINTQLPDLFVVNSISKIGSYVKKLPKLIGEVEEYEGHLSINWTKQDKDIEIVNARSGMIDGLSPVKGEFSRLSKVAFYRACLKLAEDTEHAHLQSNENYLTAKQSCQTYQQTKTIFLRHMEDQGLGHWVAKPKHVDCFKP